MESSDGIAKLFSDELGKHGVWSKYRLWSTEKKEKPAEERREDDTDEDIQTSERTDFKDVLLPRESSLHIVANAKNVKIIHNETTRVAKMILDAVKDGSIDHIYFKAQKQHPVGNDEDTLNWIFLLDSINFSFWPDEGQHYDVMLDGELQTGYFAACAAINNAMKKGVPVTSAEWMATVQKDELDEILKSHSGHSIPLLDERLKAINSSGKALLEYFNGSFFSVIREGKFDALEILRLVIKYFPSFRDFAIFEGRKVSLLKRAQILIADAHGALENHENGQTIKGIDKLTMFADYRVPQALAFLGVLEYSQNLLDVLNKKELLENGSDEEVELRGFSIAACEEIVNQMNTLVSSCDEYNNVRPLTAIEVDYYLWLYRRRHAKEIEEKIPFHRTRCIFY
ncbi:unnamed protein product [Caenorhabditis bovis]|uniref:Queuosine 5'-phosphate N-glycosylase/hydrolase n=1 Tax=Caenorhabditis bovis TaxID=2654633 RepID=A0A8S1F6Q1_9PELO|nr:unnamed protein product [Caenorhabditis bovis]